MAGLAERHSVAEECGRRCEPQPQVCAEVTALAGEPVDKKKAHGGTQVADLVWISSMDLAGKDGSMKARFIFRGLLFLLSGLATMSAQSDGQSSNETKSKTGTFFGSPVGSSKAPAARKAISLTLESFGYKSAPARNEDGLVQPAYTLSYFDLHGLECPICVAPGFRARVAIPPFGATGKLALFNDRVELFGGFGGVEAVTAPGILRPQGLRLFTSTEDDAWLMQFKAEAQVAVDPQKHIWIGGAARRFYSSGAGPRQWNSLSGQATFKLGH